MLVTEVTQLNFELTRILSTSNLLLLAILLSYVWDYSLSAIGTLRLGQNLIQVCIGVATYFIEMGRPPIPICGFGNVILYDESSDFKAHQFTM